MPQVSEEDLPWDFSAELQALASELQREQHAISGDKEPVIKVAPKKERPARKPVAAEG